MSLLKDKTRYQASTSTVRFSIFNFVVALTFLLLTVTVWRHGDHSQFWFGVWVAFTVVDGFGMFHVLGARKPS